MSNRELIWDVAQKERHIIYTFNFLTFLNFMSITGEIVRMSEENLTSQDKEEVSVLKFPPFFFICLKILTRVRMSRFFESALLADF